jgi:hypothetical protein
MNCKCGTKAFFFEKTTLDGTFNVFKCDTQETKKKGKCDFYHLQKIKEPIEKIKNTTHVTETYQEVKPRETYMKNLNKYIQLLKNTTHLPKEYSTNYIANINYILKRLNMRFYFEDTESIRCLEKRINNNECVLNISTYTSVVYPLKLTDYPFELSVPLKANRKKRRKIKTKAEIYKVDLKNYIEEDEKEKEKQEEEIDNKSDFSEDSEEMADENDDDKTFDVDDCKSDVDETFDDTGAFSD